MLCRLCSTCYSLTSNHCTRIAASIIVFPSQIDTTTPTPPPPNQVECIYHQSDVRSEDGQSLQFDVGECIYHQRDVRSQDGQSLEFGEVESQFYNFPDNLLDPYRDDLESGRTRIHIANATLQSSERSISFQRDCLDRHLSGYDTQWLFGTTRYCTAKRNGKSDSHCCTRDIQ